MRLLSSMLAVIFLSGCNTYQLRARAVQQTTTITDLQYQQVLDNLAMFYVNPNSLPYFAVPSQGQSQVRTSAQANSSISWNPVGFAMELLNFQGTRELTQFWTMMPINDTPKLLRMRCAYQIAVGRPSLDCPNCCDLPPWPWADKRPVKPATTPATPTDPPPGAEGPTIATSTALNTQSDTSGKRFQNPTLPTETRDHQEILPTPPPSNGCNDNCHLPGPGWYHVACKKKDVPHSARYVGHFADVYVWVDDGGIDSLTRLTMAILDFAIYTAQPASSLKGNAQAYGGTGEDEIIRVPSFFPGFPVLPPYPVP